MYINIKICILDSLVAVVPDQFLTNDRSGYFVIAGLVSRTVRLRVHYVRVDTKLLGILRRTGGEQRRRRMFEAAQRDYRRLRRDPG